MFKKSLGDAYEQRLIALPETGDSEEKLLKKIDAYLRVSDDQIQKKIVERYLAAEFEERITHINFDTPEKDSRIALFFNDQQYNLNVCVGADDFSDTACLDITQNVTITNRAFYVDTPFVVDILNPENVNRYRLRSKLTQYNHRHDISKLFYSFDNGNSISEEVVGKEKLKGVLDHIYSAVPGTFR